MVDTYLAGRCDALVGLGSSNVSCMAAHLKVWGEGKCVLLGDFMMHDTPNLYLHRPREQAPGRAAPGRSRGPRRSRHRGR